MATRAEELTWQKGVDGEDRYAYRLHKAHALQRGYFYLRNIAFGDGPGDIDVVLIGPMGVWHQDVKNWSHSMDQSWQAQMNHVAEMLSIQRDYLRWLLEAPLIDLGIDVQSSLVMAGHSQPYDYLGEFPIYTMDSSIKAMFDAPVVLGGDQTWALARYLKDASTRLGSPTPR